MEDKNNKKNKLILLILFVIATIILFSVGATFAYFSATANSAENAVDLTAAEFKIELEEDTDLIKTNLIPSIENYVNIASTRVDGTGNLLKPYNDPQTDELVLDHTACIDDNLREICSIYTFTIINRMTNTDVPLYITMEPITNNFENLYFKVYDSNQTVVMQSQQLIDDRPYTMNGTEKVYDANATITPIVLTALNQTLPRAANSTTPSTVTYSIVLWLKEEFVNQNRIDGGKLFEATLNIRNSADATTGITGKFTQTG